MAFKQPRIPEYRESEGTSKYLKSLVLFLKDFCMESWKAIMNIQKRLESGKGLALSPDDAPRESIKPQQPLLDMGTDKHVYPMTTYDQVILPDGSRWDGEAGKAYATLIITVNCDSGEAIAPTIIIQDVGEQATFAEFTYDGVTEVQIPAGMHCRIIPGSVFAHPAPDPVDYIAAAGMEKRAVLNYKYGRRYGYRRKKAESNPSARIEYLYDAVGMTPVSVNADTGELDMGDWQEFCDELCRPVMLKYDGTVDYELDHSDYTKKLDGTASDVANTAYGGNAMVEFRRFKWVHRREDANYEYVIFSDQNFWTEETYSAYAHTNASGVINDAFYYAMYLGATISSKSRSIKGTAAALLSSPATGFTYAQANGSGWNMLYKSAWDYVNDILTMLAKSDNEKTAKFLHFSPSWGTHTLLAGLVLKSGTYYVKMKPPYDTTGSNGYANTGIKPSGSNGAYVNAGSTTGAYGYLPKSNASGSATTYMCDILWFGTTASTTYFPVVSTRDSIRNIMITSGYDNLSFGQNRITYLAP